MYFNIEIATSIQVDIFLPELLNFMYCIISGMNEVFIFTIGITLGCVISYIFFKTGVNINMDAYNNFTYTTTTEPDITDDDDSIDTSDTSLDWDNYPYTNEYNDADNSTEIIGFIDTDTDEPN
jgi:hypothetical protein